MNGPSQEMNSTGQDQGTGAHPGSPPGQAFEQPVGTWNRLATFQGDPRTKSPFVATVLSLVPGLGQVYLGYYLQGFVNILVISSLIGLLNRGAHRLEPEVAIFMVFYWLFNLVDANRRANMINMGLAGLKTQTSPEDLDLATRHGSLLSGIAMMAIGVLMFLHTRWNISLDWIADYWPLGLVLLGTYLVFVSFKNGRPEDALSH